MDEKQDPVIAARQPCILQLAAGSYKWCACGRSKRQPFCDGSHAGTGIMPIPFTQEQEKTVALCCCKHTKRPPFCDGTHSTLPPE